MSNSLVSVIVPVFNVEKFVKECLDSISAQTHRNLEIIVVDDGSPDESGRIADECAQNDSRIKVIHKENGGVSTARNVGLDCVTGEYIIFVDSDDTLSPDYTEYMLKLITDTKSDIAISLNNFSIYNSKQIETDNFEIYSPAKAVQELYLTRIGVACWNKIYKKNFIKRFYLKFLSELWFGEGTTFTIMAFQRANHIGVGHRKVYYQRHNIESAVLKFNLKSWECGFKSLEIQKNSFIISDKKTLLAWRYHYFVLAVGICHEIMKAKLEKKNKCELKKYITIARKNIIAPFLVQSSIKNKLFYVIFFLSPKIAFRIRLNKVRRLINKNAGSK
jgi:glycosyltransferase involved in cell wall biosynthesis